MYLVRKHWTSRRYWIYLREDMSFGLRSEALELDYSWARYYAFMLGGRVYNPAKDQRNKPNAG